MRKEINTVRNRLIDLNTKRSDLINKIRGQRFLGESDLTEMERQVKRIETLIDWNQELLKHFMTQTGRPITEPVH